MSKIPMWRRYLRFLGPDVHSDVDEELAFHLEMREHDLIARGMTPEAARAEALRRFGDRDRVRLECEELGQQGERLQRRRERLDGLLQDVRFAVRGLRRAPGFALLAILTLALGIAAVTAMFTVVNGVLLRALPIEDEDRVLVVWGENPARGFGHVPFLYSMFEEYREQNRAFESLAGIDYNGAWPRAMRDDGETVTLTGIWVTGDFFRVLGVEPVLGRSLLPEDDVTGAAPVMVISHRFWLQYFGGDPAALGKSFRWNDRSFTVVGVAPQGFEYPRGTEYWTALGPLAPQLMENHLDMVGRLRPGVTLEQVHADVAGYLERTAADHPLIWQGMRPIVRALPDLIVGEVRPVLLILTVAVLLVLLIACINVANLLFVRGSARLQELAVRSALGAGRGRIIRQLLTESVVIAALAGIVGVAVAYLAIRGVILLAPSDLPRLEGVRIDPRVLGFAAGVTLITGLLAGVAPAFASAVRNPAAPLRTGGRIGTVPGGSRRLRQSLIAGQVALALLVLIGAGLLVRTLVALQRADLGFDRESIVIATLSFPPDKYAGRPAQLALMDRAMERLHAVPGVLAVTAVTRPPFSGPGGWDTIYEGEGQAAEEIEANPLLNLELASPEFFRVMGIPLIRGRAFTEHDREDAAPVAIVSETVARRTWPGEDPLGKRLGPPGNPDAWATVVGVVADTRYRELMSPRPTLYLPIRQFGGPVPASVALRTGVEPASVIPSVRNALHDVDPDVLLTEAAPLTTLMAAPLSRPRLGALLLSVFAGLALALSAVGIYGVMATNVRQRAPEIGVRMALGAQAADVRRLVIGQGMAVALAGAVLGGVAALAGTRVLSSLLFGVTPTDPLTFAAVSLLLLGVALAACYLPARRATRVDPMVTLRGE